MKLLKIDAYHPLHKAFMDDDSKISEQGIHMFCSVPNAYFIPYAFSILHNMPYVYNYAYLILYRIKIARYRFWFTRQT